MNKNYMLMRDVILKYHPKFKRDNTLKEYALANSDIFNVERLVEQTMAAVGGYKFVDGDGYDFTDYSDCKTSSIVKSRHVEIGRLEAKIGDLRIVIYNHYTNKVDFLFMPFEHMIKNRKKRCGKNGGEYRMRVSWKTDDTYSSLEQFRVGSFKELAKMPSTRNI